MAEHIIGYLRQTKSSTDANIFSVFLDQNAYHHLNSASRVVPCAPPATVGVIYLDDRTGKFSMRDA